MSLVKIKGFPKRVFAGQNVEFRVEIGRAAKGAECAFKWRRGKDASATKLLTKPSASVEEPVLKGDELSYAFTWTVEFDVSDSLFVEVLDEKGNCLGDDTQFVDIREATVSHHVKNLVGENFVENLQLGSVPIALQSAPVPEVSPADEALWAAVLAGTRAISFHEYSKFVANNFPASHHQPSGTRAYEQLRELTHDFMKRRCTNTIDERVTREAQHEIRIRLKRVPSLSAMNDTLPAVAAVQDGLQLPVPGMTGYVPQLDDHYRTICPVELIWSYWHEEAMLVQTVKAVSRRFQNRAAPGSRDPLAGLEIDPLRALSNLLWGYIQDEKDRISVLRRAYEYEHHYGISLRGRAVKSMRPADRRSKFLESFHNLLYRCVQFYKQDDDKTVSADGFPVLNAIKETHYLIAAGAHNQFGDLPETDREEKLIEQWLLARPEMREFLRGRPMVPYREEWMDRVDHMKTLQGWTDVSVVHFHDLAVFGEQLLLTIRWGAWAALSNGAVAVAWARVFRQEVQGYIHAYRAATGVDLAAEVTNSRQAEERYLPPGVLLQRRLGVASAR